MMKMCTSILLQIRYVEDKNKLKDLAYLLKEHKDVVEDSDTHFIDKSKIHKSNFTPWVIVKNEGKGLYLAKKIIEKFEPWVTMYEIKLAHKNNIPKIIRDLKGWQQKNEKNLNKMKLQ